MSGDQAASLLWAMGALVLVVSGYVARRIPARSTIKLAMAWVVIFALAFLVVALWRAPA